MTYKQKAEESLDDLVNRRRRMTQRCSLTEHEQQQRIIELIIVNTPIADFQKELLSKDKTLTLKKLFVLEKHTKLPTFTLTNWGLWWIIIIMGIILIY